MEIKNNTEFWLEGCEEGGKQDWAFRCLSDYKFQFKFNSIQQSVDGGERKVGVFCMTSEYSEYIHLKIHVFPLSLSLSLAYFVDPLKQNWNNSSTKQIN